jgi:hypothetical protein
MAMKGHIDNLAVTPLFLFLLSFFLSLSLPLSLFLLSYKREQREVREENIYGRRRKGEKKERERDRERENGS